MHLFFDLSLRTKLRVAGADSERYLNGQLTNDVRKATNQNTLEACALSAKGKLTAHVFLTRDQGDFLLDADVDLRGTLPQRLERYIIADDVHIEDVTDQFSIFHLLGVTPPELSGEFKIRAANRFGQSGYDVWAAAERHDELFSDWKDEFRFCDANCTEVLRVERGIPRWGRELTDEIIPIEANLEAGTIDYDKGCYIGQEVISRMKMSGQTNKRLCGLVGNDLERGMKIVSAEPDGKEVGWITSVAESEGLGRRIALGFVRRGFNSPGTELRAIGSAAPAHSIPVQVTDLPFVE